MWLTCRIVHTDRRFMSLMFSSSSTVYGVFGQTYRSPPLARWCLAATKVLNAITSMENCVDSENDLTPSTEEQRVRLGYLLDVAVEFFEQLDMSSPYHNTLNVFIEKARRVVRNTKPFSSWILMQPWHFIREIFGPFAFTYICLIYTFLGFSNLYESSTGI